MNLPIRVTGTSFWHKTQWLWIVNLIVFGFILSTAPIYYDGSQNYSNLCVVYLEHLRARKYIFYFIKCTKFNKRLSTKVKSYEACETYWRNLWLDAVLNCRHRQHSPLIPTAICLFMFRNFIFIFLPSPWCDEKMWAGHSWNCHTWCHKFFVCLKWKQFVTNAEFFPKTTNLLCVGTN